MRRHQNIVIIVCIVMLGLLLQLAPSSASAQEIDAPQGDPNGNQILMVYLCNVEIDLPYDSSSQASEL